MKSTKHYYRGQTQLALENFPLPVNSVHIELILAIVEIKKAACIANTNIKILPKAIADNVLLACDEVISGKYQDNFVTPAIQGGAGTSINMNVNEVLASLAEEISENNITVHPNDHVNLSQSTNDVNPSALKIAVIRLTQRLVQQLESLENALLDKAYRYKHVKKLGRTHIQDAVPTTMYEEFTSYQAIIARDKKRLQECLLYLLELNLGGTAIGNGINASEEYTTEVYKALSAITKLPVKPASNLMSQTSSSGDFCQVSAMHNILFTDLSKIATDIRFMSSGPHGGIGEITLTELQKGSSIMPGKVNPIIPETINQVAYYVAGKNLTIHEAATNASLELAIMFPVLADALISSLKLGIASVLTFTEKCIKTLTVNENRCSELLEKSTAYATLLVPELGYDAVTALVKRAHKEHKTIKEILLENKETDNKKPLILS